MKKEDFKVGMTVWLRPINNSARYGKKEPIEKTVTKIGKKLITLDGYKPLQFNITNDFIQKSNYSPDYELYLTKQDILDEDKARMLLDKIEPKIKPRINRKYLLPLDKVEQIAKILDIE